MNDSNSFDTFLNTSNEISISASNMISDATRIHEHRKKYNEENLMNFSMKEFYKNLEPPYEQYEWIVCEVVLLSCAAVAVYILFALIYFYYLQPKRLKLSGRRTGSRWLEKMCILSVVLAVLRMANNQALLFAGWQSPDRCSVLLNVSIAMYFLALHPVYLFLWIRQRIFYSNRALKHLYGRGVRFLSWATILCFFVVTGVSMVMFVVDRNNSASGRVCLQNQYIQLKGFTESYLKAHRHLDLSTKELIEWLTSNGSYMRSFEHDLSHNGLPTNKYHGLKVNTIAGLLAGCMQVSFLVLFLYPIMDNKLREVRNHKLKCHHSLMKLIRRAFVLSGVCIITDVTIALAVGSIHTAHPRAVYAPLVIYDINLLVNIVCIISTFRRWRGMLVPCYFFYCYRGGKSLIRGSSKVYYLARRSAMDDTNGMVRKYINNVETVNYAQKSIIEPPKVDVILDSDAEANDCSNESQISNEPGERCEISQIFEENIQQQQNSTHSTPKSSGFSRFSRFKSSRKTVNGCKQRAVLQTNSTAFTPFIATSRLSLRAKSRNNIVTTKITLKSEMWVSNGDQEDDEL